VRIFLNSNTHPAKKMTKALYLLLGLLHVALLKASEEEPNLYFFTDTVIELAECDLTTPVDTQKIDVSFYKNSAVIARETIRGLDQKWSFTVPEISVAQVDLELVLQLQGITINNNNQHSKTCRVFSNSWSWKNLDPPYYYFGTRKVSKNIETALKKLGAKAIDEPATCSSNLLLMFGLDFEENPEQINDILRLLKAGKNIMVIEPFTGSIALEKFKGLDIKLSSAATHHKKSPLEAMHQRQNHGFTIQCVEEEARIVVSKAENAYPSVVIGTGPYLTFTSLDFAQESERPLLLAYLLHTMKAWEAWHKDWFNEIYDAEN
jgi:hypothetical protein